MKRIASLTLILFASLLSAHPGEHTHLYEEVTTKELKSMVDSKQAITIVDARTKDHDDKNRIPGAISLPFNASDSDIASALPSKEKTIVVYCTNKKCPASTFLAERLATLGYKHVYRYSEGVNAWIKQGYHVDHAH